MQKIVSSFESGLEFLSNFISKIPSPYVPALEIKYDLRGKSLFSVSSSKVSALSSSEIRMVPLSQIIEDPQNVRRSFDGEKIQALAESIKHVGLIEELFLERISSSKYKIIAGHRRYRAQQINGEKECRAIIVEGVDSIDRLCMQIAECSQSPFNPSERATHWYRLYKFLNVKRAESGESLMSVSEFASKIGKHPSTVREAFSFLSLPDGVRNVVDLGLLSYSAAIEISHIPQRFDKERRTYLFDPDRDFYLTPEQVFYAGKNSYEGLQLILAIRAAFYKLTRKQVSSMIASANPNLSDDCLLFSREEVNKIRTSCDREMITKEIEGVLRAFRPGVEMLCGGTRQKGFEAIFDYHLIVEKYGKLKEQFGELKNLLSPI